MIRHVVTFKFKAETAEGKSAAASQLRESLEPLAASVPGVRFLQFGIDNGSVEGHWNAVLITEHDSFQELSEYQVHPHHRAVLDTVGDLVSEKSIVDYEF
ncbi:MAG: Dabb family protein [Gulosibacter sp.]|uniref:Dabb family protein n=1 Tax=Gulosibacter sp. TaxID=2817531 RepID=UPI003F8EF1D1